MSANTMKTESLPLNYFTCTLGQAAGRSLCGLADLENINDFIDHQAEKFPNHHAVGFPVPSSNGREWTYQLLTFKELRKASIIRAQILTEDLDVKNPDVRCVALLWPSSIEFLITWLALMRCGFSVLLIAPQCTPEAVAGLCKACNVKELMYHESYGDLAIEAVSVSESGLCGSESNWKLGDNADQYRNHIQYYHSQRLASCPRPNQQDTAFIFHTSGTSTGIPSPIRQSHRAAFAVLPVLDGSSAATSTTTPLYHGGIADCFRAWSSSALIWLFPGADVPITTANILKCLESAEEATTKDGAASVRYFSCVPYVLQTLYEEESGAMMLNRMEIVGVGGAALGKSLGFCLVDRRIPLVSRFGSAECGFLMSSYRDFDTDNDWDYLRYDLQSDRLVFEPCEDGSGLSELVVKPTWPHLAKTNRKDGSFATSDLFEPHPTTPNAWRYHSRKDGQITMSTGKKFDPAPLEEEISSSSPMIREAMVVGSGRQTAGIIVFLSTPITAANVHRLDYEVWSAIKTIVSKYPSHARIFRQNCMFLTTRKALPRSSKGTLMRGVAEKMLAEEIDGLYDRSPASEGVSKASNGPISWEYATKMVLKAVKQVLRDDQDLDPQDDFYTHGVDSLMCTRIRASLQQDIAGFSQGEHALPWNVVYDCGNILSLCRFISNLESSPSPHDREAEMFETVMRFASTNVVRSPADSSGEVLPGMVVLLTGVTGALGAHILACLLDDRNVRRIFCLVRAADEEEACRRVSKSLADRGRKPLSGREDVSCYPYDINKPCLGLKPEAHERIYLDMTHIIHAAWDVNFSLPLRSFNPHFNGLQELLNIAYKARNSVTFSFCSSVASVSSRSNEDGTSIKEATFTCSDASPTGYGMSKWVGETICFTNAMNRETNQQRRRKVKVKILRLGQLTGDTVTGAWNRSEAWPRMISTVDILGCLPRLEDQPLDWLPLDTAAKAVVETTLAEDDEDNGCKVYHIVQHKREKNWIDLLGWIKDIREKDFEVVETKEWLERLKTWPEEHPAKALLGLWKKAYGEGAEKSTASEFAVDEAKRVSPTMRDLEALSEEQGKVIWKWLNSKN